MSSRRPPASPVGLLRATADLRRLGEDPAGRDASGARHWVRVRHGVVARAAVWQELRPEQRHAALVRATAMQMRGEMLPTFSHASAAAMWGLPRISSFPARVDVSMTGSGVRSSGLVRRHVAEVADPVMVDGLPTTTVPRTVVDLARVGALADAVAAADHALHHGLCVRAELAAELERVASGARGRARAALVLRLADAGAMSAGESLSRVQMFRLNLPRPRLQVEVRDADGLVGYCDFGWEGVMGEFDGRRKYGLSAARPDEVEQALWREKQREDRIRRRGHRMARWVWLDVVHPERMARILATQGIRPTARNSWFDAA